MKAVSKLSREELLELLAGNPFIIGGFTEQNINAARARVLRKKAEEAFEKWQAISEKNRASDVKGPKQLSAYYAAMAEGESFFKKYQSLWDWADRIEFGHLIKKEVNHAAE